ncbi:MAG TPA: aliphatic sulfonate ABC transporter substrate-binding protein [Tepidisphaeraceae bacterium]|nr:aliphatic sulfonate ABC transporter substrate-binding protein [Tepidisphaeraceae bacterium]
MRIAVASLVLLVVAGTVAVQYRARAEDSPAEVRFGYFANVTHAQAVLAVANGDLEKAVAPAKLTTRVFNAGPSVIEALFAGEIDVAYIGPGPAISAHGKSRGEGIRIISGAAANGVAIVARNDSPIRTLQDLKDKRIATPQLGNTQDIAAKHYLKTTLGQSNVNNVLPIANAEQATMMARGEIDAAWVPEPWAARLIADGHRLIAEESALWPSNQFSLTLVTASPAFLEKHRETAVKILAVHKDWTRRLQSEPAEQVQPLSDAILALTSKRIAPEVIADSLKRVTFTTDPMPSTLETMSKWSFDLGFSRDEVSIKGLVDLSALQAAPEPSK